MSDSIYILKLSTNQKNLLYFLLQNTFMNIDYQIQQQITQAFTQLLPSYISQPKCPNWPQIVHQPSYYNIINKITTHNQYLVTLIQLIKGPVTQPINQWLKRFYLHALYHQILKINYLANKQLFQFILQQLCFSQYRIQSISIARNFRKVLSKIFSKISHHQIYNSKVMGYVFPKLDINDKHALIKNLNILIVIFQKQKYSINDNQSNQIQGLLQQGFSCAVKLLNEHSQTFPLATYLCCKIISNALGFVHAQQIFLQKYNQSQYHTFWITKFMNILESKWFMEDRQNMYKDQTKLQYVYLHIKKSALKGFKNFIIRLNRIDRLNTKKKLQFLSKYSNIPLEQCNQIFNKVCKLVIQQLEYQYPIEIKKLQINFIQKLYWNYRQFVSNQTITRIQKALLKYMTITKQDQMKMIKSPYEYELEYQNWNISNTNLRLMAVSFWVQISFNTSKNNKKSKKSKSNSNDQLSEQKLVEQSLNMILESLKSSNPLQVQTAFTILSIVQVTNLKKLNLQQKLIYTLFDRLDAICSSQIAVLRTSGFRALANITKSAQFNKLSQENYLRLAQKSYDHLTKDESVLVRISAGICYMRLSLKQKCVEWFKQTMYECIIVLLNIMQQISLESVGMLLNEILKGSEYSLILMPLSKQIFMFSCNSFLQLFNMIVQSQKEQQQLDRTFLLISCSQIIMRQIESMSYNDLLPSGVAQQKLQQMIGKVYEAFKLQQDKSYYNYEQIYQSIIKITDTFLFHVPQLKPGLYQLISEIILKFFIFFCQYDFAMSLSPFINLTKHRSKPQLQIQVIENIRLIKQKTAKLQGNNQQNSIQTNLNILNSFIIINMSNNAQKNSMHYSAYEQEQQQFIKDIIKQNQSLFGQANILANNTSHMHKNIISSMFLYSAVFVTRFDQVFQEMISKNKLTLINLLKFGNHAYKHATQSLKNLHMDNETSKFYIIYKLYILANLGMLKLLLKQKNILMNATAQTRKQVDMLLQKILELGNTCLQIREQQIVKNNGSYTLLQAAVVVKTKSKQIAEQDASSNPQGMDNQQQSHGDGDKGGEENENWGQGSMNADEEQFLQQQLLDYNLNKCYNKLQHHDQLVALQKHITAFSSVKLYSPVPENIELRMKSLLEQLGQYKSKSGLFIQQLGELILDGYDK